MRIYHKYLITSIFLVILVIQGLPALFAQVLVSDDAATTPHASAVLEMKSTSKGFLPPRMDQSEIAAINNPIEGMLVYNLTKKLPVYYDGSAWVDMTGAAVSTTLEIGDYYKGGIIYYLDGMGGGLIAAIEDLDDGGTTSFDWGCFGTEVFANSTTDGAANTDSILANCATADIGADVTDDYSYDGYSDWFIPAIDQLDSMYVHRDDIGGFTTDVYWSSTESSGVAAPNSVQGYWFLNGTYFPILNKNLIPYRIRPIRSF